MLDPNERIAPGRKSQVKQIGRRPVAHLDAGSLSGLLGLMNYREADCLACCAFPGATGRRKICRSNKRSGFHSSSPIRPTAVLESAKSRLLLPDSLSFRLGSHSDVQSSRFGFQPSSEPFEPIRYETLCPSNSQRPLQNTAAVITESVRGSRESQTPGAPARSTIANPKSPIENPQTHRLAIDTFTSRASMNTSICWPTKSRGFSSSTR